MPRQPGALRRPNEWVNDFPDGTVDVDAPPGVVELAAAARTLRDLVAGGSLTISGLARDSGVDRTSIHDLLAGRVWIDTSTLARLESAAGVLLWRGQLPSEG